MSQPVTPWDWGDVYAEREATYESFAERLEELLRNLAQTEDLNYEESFSWTSDVDGFVSQILIRAREGRPVSDPFAEFGGVAGVTIVTHSKLQSERVCDLVEREFEVDHDSSVPYAEAEANSADIPSGGTRNRIYYDYPSFVVTLPAERAVLTEWSEYADLRAEIRVQTVLQRAWCDVDEGLAFVWDSSYAEGAREAILRTATYIAEADEALANVDRETGDTLRTVKAALAAGELDVRLDAPSLWVYLMESPVVTHLVELGEGAGLESRERWATDWEVEQRLLWMLRARGITTLRDLDDLLRSSEPRAAAILGSIAELATEDDVVPTSAPVSIVCWLVLVTSRADAGTVAAMSWRPAIQNALNTLIGNAADVDSET